jgi:hypothetical protein
MTALRLRVTAHSGEPPRSKLSDSVIDTENARQALARVGEQPLDTFAISAPFLAR